MRHKKQLEIWEKQFEREFIEALKIHEIAVDSLLFPQRLHQRVSQQKHQLHDSIVRGFRDRFAQSSRFFFEMF